MDPLTRAVRWTGEQLQPDPKAPPLWHRLRLGAGVVLLVGLAVLLALALGSGAAAVLAALAAMFTLLGAFGASLRADLRVLTWFAPALVVSLAATHALAQVSPWAALAVVVPVVALAGCLSAAGPRARAVGNPLASAAALGMGLTSLGPSSPTETLLACASGAGLVVLWRVLRGLADPSRRTRGALARMFTDPAPVVAQDAWRLLRTDRPVAWMLQVARSGQAYRIADRASRSWASPAPPVDAAQDPPGEDPPAGGLTAAQVAELVTPRRPGAGTARTDGPSDAVVVAGSGGAARLAQVRRSALRDAARAARERDTTPVTLPPAPRTDRTALDSLRSWSSPALRHALRSALAVAVVGVVVARDPSNPLAPTMMSTSVSLLQPSLPDTAGRVVQRTVGILLGVAVTLGLLEALPTPLITVAGLAAVVFLFGVFGRSMPLFYAATAVLTIMLRAGTGAIAPGSAPWTYLAALLGVIAVTLVIGFAVVPGVHEDPVELSGAVLDAAGDLVRAEADDDRRRARTAAAARAVQRVRAVRLPRSARDATEQVQGLADALDGLVADVGALRLLAAVGAVRSEPAAEVLTIAHAVLDPDRPVDAAQVEQLQRDGAGAGADVGVLARAAVVASAMAVRDQVAAVRAGVRTGARRP